MNLEQKMNSNDNSSSLSSSSSGHLVIGNPAAMMSSSTPSDYVRLLDMMFQGDSSGPSQVEAAFELFEKNFAKQPTLLNVVIDYYYEHSLSSIIRSDIATDYSHTALFYSSNKKTVIDLIYLVPDDLVNKLFDRMLDKLLSQPLSNLASSIQTNLLRVLEKTIYLLVLISNRRKSWLTKLCSHSLLSNLIKLIKTEKASMNLNELIAVQISMLLTAMINTNPLQVQSTHLDGVFHVLYCLLKYLTQMEQNKTYTEGMIWPNVKWSIRLFFYVCYGLYTNQFIQFMRKKDQNLISKDFLASVMFYLRLHPALIKERVDNEKQLKQNQDYDFSVEWRQYCLDPLFTNYDRIIRNMIQSSSLAINKSSPPKVSQNLVSNQLSKLASIGSNTSAHSASSSLILSLQQQQFNMPTDHFYLPGSNSYSPMPISPSYIFANSNRSTNPNSKKLSNLVPSIPNTPATASQNASIVATGSASGTPQQLAFQFPSLSSYENDKRPIQNLTSRFMKEEQTSTQVYLGKLSKSVSDSNLFMEPSHMEQKLIREMLKKGQQPEPSAWNARSNKNANEDFRNRVKSEMRDRNIIEDSLNSTRMNFSSTQTTNPAFFHSMSEQEQQAGYVSDQISAQLARLNSSELGKSSDIISGFFSTFDQSPTIPNTSPESMNAVIGKLKQEVNHLVLQLIYEKHLRDKYEEDSNRLHFIRIERDQLLVEKNNLQLNLKELVDRYKNEVEQCLGEQNKMEISIYKRELDEKNAFIENLQSKLVEQENELNLWSKRYDELKLEKEKINREYGIVRQQAENDQNLRAKLEIDQNYIKSLRHTTDILRKKLLVMSKSQRNLVESFNQEVADLSLINSSKLNTVASMVQDLNRQNPNGGQSAVASLLLTPLYSFQQDIIQTQQEEMEKLRKECNDVIRENMEQKLELDQCKRELKEKELKIDELTQTLTIDVLDWKSEFLRSHNRIQTSLWHVNKRLEEEIIGLRASLSLEQVRNAKFSAQMEHSDNSNSFSS